MSTATIIFLIIFVLILMLHLYRQYWANRELAQVHTAEFDGELYKVGETYIARRQGSDASKTIVCFPGFLEDMRYFQALYADTDCELVLVNNAYYHNPFPSLEARPLSWQENPFEMGTIEHDGFYLGHILRELVGGQRIYLHGHSRGGAVVLEAGRQFPELMQSTERDVTAILEAAVVPQGRNAGKASGPFAHRIICYLMPIVLGLSRKSGVDKLLKQPMMRPTNDLKTALCQGIYSNARNYKTCVVNVQSIVLWQAQTSHDVYRNFPKITAVIGKRDDVLDNPTMIASAEVGAGLNRGMNILRTEKTNHFPSLEEPHYLRSLISS
ncbi:MAG: pimeloyl-ACP methyl ester carboxylesterase [Bacteroidia bacterium]|jgi:pimeloyl-ACP methyl ester carboxylesterase